MSFFRALLRLPLLILLPLSLFLKAVWNALFVILPLRAAARAGDAGAQYELACKYASGKVVATDHAKAARWFRTAAEQGHAVWLSRAAGLDDTATPGTPDLSGSADRDARQATPWPTASRPETLAFAMPLPLYKRTKSILVLLLCLIVRLFQRPAFENYFALLFRAETGDPLAQHVLACRYAEGAGLPRDMERAAFWFRKAAEQGHAGARKALAHANVSV